MLLSSCQHISPVHPLTHFILFLICCSVFYLCIYFYFFNCVYLTERCRLFFTPLPEQLAKTWTWTLSRMFCIALLMECSKRHLVTAYSYCSIAFSYRVFRVFTVEIIILNVAIAIWERFVHSQERSEVKQKWNFSNCVCAIDGKHIVIDTPASSGHSFKTITFPIVLLAVNDISYQLPGDRCQCLWK